MIVGKQIRAARALLDLSQEELAEHAGLTPQAIRRIEDGAVQPREGTISDIVRVFNDHGVEFTDNHGVKFAPEGLNVLNGPNGLSQFLDGVYEYLQRHGGEVMVTGVLDHQWTKHGGEHIVSVHIPRMTKLCAERKDITVYSLCPEGTRKFDYDGYTQYRSQPRELFESVPFYVYGDNLAIIVFQSDPPPKIILIRSKVVAEAYRKQFKQLWNLANEIPNKRASPSQSKKKRRP
jgi:DNA-binding XRE family transcriptional regulator